MLCHQSLNCQVCGSQYAQNHFGTVSCRACAAFFRRFVHSKKKAALCTCISAHASKHPCRSCRIKKCINAGMKISYVQSRRDSNYSNNLESHCETSPINNFRLCIQAPIALRSLDRLHKIQESYTTLLDVRNSLKISDIFDENVDMYAFSCMAMHDLDIMKNMLEGAIPEFTAFEEIEKKKICANFYTKWSVIEAVMYAIQKQELWNVLYPSGQPPHSIEKFYTVSQQNKNLTKQDLTRIFSPYWAYFLNFLVPEVAHQKLHNTEFMALLAIVLLDPGYSNLSEESAEMCRGLKSLYLKELVAYCRESKWDESDRRFLKILDLLQHIEKGEAMNREELQMCLIHDIKVNDDYRKLLIASKY